MNKVFKGFLLIILILNLCISCAPRAVTTAPDYTKSKVYDFNQGISIVSQVLTNQYEQYILSQRSAVNKVFTDKTKKLAIIDPFILQETGEILKINSIIENVLSQHLSPFLIVTKINYQQDKNIEFVINGFIAFENNPDIGAKTYHLYSSIFEKKSGLIIGSADVWLKNLDYKPLEIYKDSPVYIKDTILDKQIESTKRIIGDKVDQDYLKSLDIKSLYAMADEYYEKREYGKALSFYKEAERRPDGKTMKVYSSLYNIYFLTKNYADAEMSFANLIDVGVVEKNSISVKMLFKVNSPAFVDNIKMRNTGKEYVIWLRQISSYTKNHPQLCLKVIGHASRTGADAYNIQLSKKRAEAVRMHMSKYYPGILKKSQTKGMGYRENLIGSGADDDSDSIDRRVEFLLYSCTDN